MPTIRQDRRREKINAQFKTGLEEILERTNPLGKTAFISRTVHIHDPLNVDGSLTDVTLKTSGPFLLESW